MWSVIRADHNPAIAVDVEHLGFGSAMDINSMSGLAFHTLHSSYINIIYIYKYNIYIYNIYI